MSDVSADVFVRQVVCPPRRDSLGSSVVLLIESCGHAGAELVPKRRTALTLSLARAPWAFS
jgi:hypothetical protein